MIITKMHLSRRTVLRGLGASLALPLLDSMVPALTALAEDRRGAGAAARRLLRAERHVDAVLVPEGRRTARRSCRRRCSRSTQLKDRVLLVRRAGRRGREPGQGRRRSRAIGRHVPDLRAVQDHVGRRRVRGGVDGSDRGGGVRRRRRSWRRSSSASSRTRCSAPATAARAARTRTRSPGGRRRRRCRSRTIRAPSSSGCSARPAAPTRRRALARMQRDRSILDFVGDEVGEPRSASSARSDKIKIDEYLDSVRDIERRIQMAEQQNSRELPVVDQPVGVPDRLRRARQADDGPAGAGLSDRPDAHQHVHAGARGERPRVSGDRRHRLAPPAVASPGRAGQARAAAQDQRVPLPAVRVSGRRSWPTMPEGDGTMLDHTLFLYGTGISDSNTHFHDDLPIALVGGKAAGIKAGRYIRHPKGTPLANLHVSVLDKLGFRVEKLGDATGQASKPRYLKCNHEDSKTRRNSKVFFETSRLRSCLVRS